MLLLQLATSHDVGLSGLTSRLNVIPSSSKSSRGDTPHVSDMCLIPLHPYLPFPPPSPPSPLTSLPPHFPFPPPSPPFTLTSHSLPPHLPFTLTSIPSPHLPLLPLSSPPSHLPFPPLILTSHSPLILVSYSPPFPCSLPCTLLPPILPHHSPGLLAVLQSLTTQLR